MNIQLAINYANQKLKKDNIYSYQLDSEILMSKVIKKSRKHVILNLKNDLSESQLNYFNKLIEERSKGKPISYLIGTKDFWKFKFDITEGVLIPRPDTELILSLIHI